MATRKGSNDQDQEAQRASSAKSDDGEQQDNVVRRTVSTSVDTTGGVGHDIVYGVRNVLRDTISVTEDVGSDLGRVARHTAVGVIEGAGAVGGATVNTTRDLLVGVVGGVKDVLGAAMPGNRHHAHHRTERAEQRE